MLTEGKPKLYTYRVAVTMAQYKGCSYVEASSAQQAVDIVRQRSISELIKVTEVAKVVNNWK